MKKLITLILALVLILSLCTAAFATGDEQVEQTEQLPAEQTEQTEVTSSTNTITGANSGDSQISYTVTGTDSYEVTYPGSYTFNSEGVAPANFKITINDLSDSYNAVQLSLLSSNNGFKLVNGTGDNATSLQYGFVTLKDKDGNALTKKVNDVDTPDPKTLAAEDVFLVTMFDNQTMTSTNKEIDVDVTITSSIANIRHGTYSDTVTFKAEPIKVVEEINDIGNNPPTENPGEV